MIDIRDIVVLENNVGVEFTVTQNESLKMKNGFLINCIICIMIGSAITIIYYVSENRKLKVVPRTTND